MLTGLKNLFTTSGICFLFVAGKDLHERWLRDLWRGDSVYESVFSYDKYLPCMWADVDALCEQLTVLNGRGAVDEAQSRVVFNNFKHYLRFKGRGIPRRMLRAFNELVAWDSDGAVLAFPNDQLRRVNFYSQLNKLLETNGERLFGRSNEEMAGTRQDRLKLGVYYVTDWVLRQGTSEFAASDLLNASRELSSRIALAEEIATGTISELLEVLAEGEYIEPVDQKLDQVAIDPGKSANEKRYRLTERRLAEMSGIISGSEDERKVFDAPDPSRETPTQRLGNYELQEILGQGGMGSVYRAWDTVRRRFVALKILHPWLSSNPDAQKRFRRELATLERLNHPNIVSFLDSGESESQFFLAMEFIEGIDLDAVIRSQGALETETAMAVLIPIGNAIEFAHGRGFLRLDVKPNNIRISTSGHVYLMDVGIARHIASEEDSKKTITGEGTFVGTPYYLAPEQARGDTVDHRVDIYSFGIVLYEALTGQRPFEGGDAFTVALKHINESPPAPSQFASMPKALERVILRCLEKTPAARFQSMKDVIEALKNWGGPNPEADLASLTKRVKQEVRRAESERNAATMVFYESSILKPAPASPASPVGSPPPDGKSGSVTHMPEDASYEVGSPPAYPPAPVAAPRVADEDVRADTLPWLELRRDGPQPEHHSLSKDITSIGRDPTNDVCLSGATAVSRFHTRILREGDRFLMIDLNSSNGTYVNGARVFEPVPLKDRDQFDVGDAHFVFHASL